jgi:colicin import membrane protein
LQASATGEAEPIEAAETNDVPTGPLPRHPFEHVLEFERLSVVAPVTYEELPGALEQLRARKAYLKYVDGVRTGGLQKEKERQAQKAIEKAAAKAAAEEKRKADEAKRAEEQRLADAAVPKEPEPIETPSKSQDVIDNADSTAKEEAQIAAEEAAPEPQQEQPDEESKSGADLVATEVSVDEASAEPETDSTAAEEPQPE